MLMPTCKDYNRIVALIKNYAKNGYEVKRQHSLIIAVKGKDKYIVLCDTDTLH